MFCNGIGFGFGGTVVTIGLLLIVGSIIYLLYKSARRASPVKAEVYEEPVGRALEILSERFAAGEISEAEYLARKKQILYR